jgi:peptide chain release factor subunit 1
VTREEAMLGRYDGTDVEPIETVESHVPSRRAAAGRAEDRFRGRSEERRTEFFDAVAERLVGPFPAEYAAEPGLRRLVDEAADAGTFGDDDAREALGRFLEALNGEAPAVGGRAAVERALEHDAVETLLLSDSLPPAEARPLEERAAASGADRVVVPGGLERAERLRDSFDGTAALTGTGTGDGDATVSFDPRRLGRGTKSYCCPPRATVYLAGKRRRVTEWNSVEPSNSRRRPSRRCGSRSRTRC